MRAKKQYPVHATGNKEREVQVNDTLTHPLEQGARGIDRTRWKYHFLRVTRFPTPDRPDSGRILVENVLTGRRTEHYALLFGVNFQG